MEFQKISSCDKQNDPKFHIVRRFMLIKCQKYWYEENENILRVSLEKLFVFPIYIYQIHWKYHNFMF